MTLSISLLKPAVRQLASCRRALVAGLLQSIPRLLRTSNDLWFFSHVSVLVGQLVIISSSTRNFRSLVIVVGVEGCNVPVSPSVHIA